MSYQEKRSIVNIVSSILIMGGYAYYVFGINGAENKLLIEDFAFWAKFILILIPVTIVAKIIVYILFGIVNTVATREEMPSVTDERDKLIDLKAERVSHYLFIFGFMLGLIVLLTDWPQYLMFVVMISMGLIAEIVGESSRFYFYRKGL